MIPEAASRYRIYRAGDSIVVRFSNIQDAVSVYNNANITRPDWATEYVTPAVCAEVCYDKTALSTLWDLINLR